MLLSFDGLLLQNFRPTTVPDQQFLWLSGSKNQSPFKPSLESTMNKIIVYENFDFQGLSREYTSDVSDLVAENFDNCVSSVKVIGNPWVAYEHTNYYGHIQVYEEGEHARVEDDNVISSLKMVREDLTNPQITLYEHSNYQGRQLVLRNETNLCHGSFNDVASSHKVQRGAWLLYQNPDKTGHRMLARFSQDVPDYGHFHDKLSYVVPLKPGKPSVSAEVLWDKKEEHVQSVVIDSISSVNRSSQERTFTTEMGRDYETSVTESFNFSNSTEISWGTSFGINVEMVKAESKFSLSNTFKVEWGKNNTRTEKKSVRISLPNTVSPNTKLTVNVVRKQVSVKVPVKLIITTGSQCKEEYGEYRCQSGESITTEYDEEKI
ncbi:epidermal differentiation-specific protein-like [Astyanax mexicanus]|uniref:Epidermal differentiation-specific protein-like n=1 Tax=Astyanax mexicanus TaxID=7994 RepID=A0A8T2KZL1_ASTMX|nr:epidermal differentiation-specific protein-like [Astyanax mexicanus]